MELHTFPTPTEPAPQASPFLAKAPTKGGIKSNLGQHPQSHPNPFSFFQIVCAGNRIIRKFLPSKYTCDIVPSHQFRAGLSLWSTDLLIGLRVLYLLETVLRTTI